MTKWTHAARRTGLVFLAAASLSCRPGADGSMATMPTRIPETPMQDGDQTLEAFLAKIDLATNQMANSDSRLWEQLYSHADDATLFGGWGGHEKGWDQLAGRWRMVTGRFRTGRMTVEPLARHVHGDLAVTVQLVRGEATFSDGSGGKVGLRVTHVLRREAGGWRIVHRHADEQLRLLPISSHIQPADE